MNADGSNIRNLTQNTGYLSSDYPDWSPDGKYILFSGYDQQSGRGGVWLMRADGSERRRLFAGGVTPVWQP